MLRLLLHWTPALVLLAAPLADAHGKTKAIPAWKKVETQVRRHFAAGKNYRPGDIISQSQAEGVFTILRVMGWSVTDRAQITALTTDDDDYLVRQLRTREGRKLMRKVAKLPGAYDQLHRLMWMKAGKQMLRDVIARPEGFEAIKQLQETRTGQHVARGIARRPKANKFNQPTGKIYTEDQFVARLKQSYQRDTKARRKKQDSSGGSHRRGR